MQRWIAAAVLAMMVICAGGAVAYWVHHQNRPAPMWVELPINPDRTDEERERTAKELLAKLRDEKLLTQVSKDLDLPAKWHLNTDGEAQRELASRIFVKIGETGQEMAKVPAIHIGVRGTLKERDLSGKIAMRLMEDVWKILGIKRPPDR